MSRPNSPKLYSKIYIEIIAFDEGERIAILPLLAGSMLDAIEIRKKSAWEDHA